MIRLDPAIRPARPLPKLNALSTRPRLARTLACAAGVSWTSLIVGCGDSSEAADESGTAPISPAGDAPTSTSTGGGSTAAQGGAPAASAPNAMGGTPSEATASPGGAPNAAGAAPDTNGNAGASAGGASGTGGVTATGGAAPGLGENSSSTLPTDDSLEALVSFLEAEAYMGEGWTAQTETPRDAEGLTSPHGRVRVYLNDVLLDSKAAGNGGIVADTQHTVGSMAVKEMYDDADNLVGIAALYKGMEGSTEAWTYHCYAEGTRCDGSSAYTEDSRLHGNGILACGGCHGAEIFTNLE